MLIITREWCPDCGDDKPHINGQCLGCHKELRKSRTWLEHISVERYGYVDKEFVERELKILNKT